jgi:membrane-associated phospholipid phosphatase
MPTRARLALLGAMTGVALLFLIWYVAFHVGVVEHSDERVLSGFADLQGRVITWLATAIANVCDPKPYVFLAGAVVLVALLLRRGRVTVAVAGILLGANATTEILKSLLVRAHPIPINIAGTLEYKTSAWPSGHATAAMTLALCAVLVAQARWRPVVAAAGAAFAVAVSFAFLTLAWHYPTDVLGGYLVAATWTLIGVAAVWTADAHWPRAASRSAAVRLTARQALGPPIAAAVGALALVGLVVLARPQPVVAYAHAHKAFVFGAAAIGAFGLALATGLVLATTLRRDSDEPAPPESAAIDTGPAIETDPVPTAAPRRG